jgi:hypothetical protein
MAADEADEDFVAAMQTKRLPSLIQSPDPAAVDLGESHNRTKRARSQQNDSDEEDEPDEVRQSLKSSWFKQ